MIKPLAITLLSLAPLFITTECLAKKNDSTSKTVMLGNQLGFKIQQQKTVVVPNTSATRFQLVDSKTKKVVFSGMLTDAKEWPAAQESVKQANFSAFQYSGTFTLLIDGMTPFDVKINDDVYHDALAGTIKYYYFNRSSTALEERHAGKFHRPASHPDTIVYIDASAATPLRPVGTVISSPKGWFDAGDFSKYIVNSSITVHTLLRALDNKPELFAKLNLNIPESGNSTPDLLDEILWNLDWMMSMQDVDGGLYHKLTTQNFEGIAMPHMEYQPRYVVQKTTAATLDFAATLAMASRVIANYETQLPGRAKQYQTAALNAWRWAEANPNIVFEQPEDFKTGMYRLTGDDYKDEWVWARAELFTLTGDKKFLKGLDLPEKARTPEWGNVETLALITLAKDEKTPLKLKEQALSVLQQSADQWVLEAENSGYSVAMANTDFHWGSNGVAANKAMALFSINQLIPKTEYVTTATGLFDYLFGRNPNAISYVSGFGKKSMRRPHHRASMSDDIKEPIPGMLAGGPHIGYQDIEGCKKEGVNSYEHVITAKSYLDHSCSYATNEVAINWNAALVYVLTEMH